MDGIGALVRLAAQLDVDALLGLFVFMALRLGGFDCGQEEKARVGGVRQEWEESDTEREGEREKHLFLIDLPCDAF